MKPIRVMIVDDEILAIDHLTNLIDWNELGFEIAAQALTANAALEQMETVQPKLIFMDIRMPVLNGLELSRRILSRYEGVKIVLCTSYRDFEYAKTALEIGVVGYWLKHETNKANLTELLIKLRSNLGKGEQQERFVFRQHLKEVMAGDEQPGESLKKLERNAKASGNRFLLLYMQSDTPFPVLDYDWPAARLPQPAEWEEICGNAEWRSLTWMECIATGKDKQIAFLSAATCTSEKQFHSETYSLASFLQNEAGARGYSISIMISSSFVQMDVLSKRCRELAEKSAYLMLFGKQAIQYAHDFIVPAFHLIEQWRARAKEIGTLLEGHNEDQLTGKLTECIRAAFVELRPERFHPEGLKLICRTFIRVLEQLRRMNGMPSYEDLFIRKEIEPNSWYSVNGIELWFLDEIDCIQSFSKASSPYSRKVQQAMSYIHEHYMDELTVELIGESLSVSGDYLRHLFKAEVGRTVTDYLTGVRIDKAKEMLKTGTYKTYEISERVGYRTGQYFSQVFKKWTGLTPQEYAERSGQGK
ncbi:response regulator transcription factor [Paenibacillus arenilitoris]|uniref:Response regulator n=1 Tax=Paenibacillus arenilitoris TaxID=2772299 RepID=A0A927CNS7_9BACL|nr:response regulator [Paenibacillus arenilitoris]MBD2868975.1 response regulator [Paenibacillus arenilitoris]